MRSTRSSAERRRGVGARPERLLRAACASALAALALAGAVRGLLDVSLAPLAALLPACPLREASGWPCPGCGTTRAFVHLAELRVVEAFEANPTAPLLALGVAAYALHPGARFWRRVGEPRPAAAALALVVGLWGLRVLGA